MLYLLTFLSLLLNFLTTTLATSKIFSFGKEDFLKNYPVKKFQTSFPERSMMIEKSEGGNDYVLEKFFANENCNNDGNQLFERVGMRSGYCLVSDRKSVKRRTCQSSVGCDDERLCTVNQYVGIDQCLLPSANITNTHTLQPYQGVSYGCNNVYIPGGFWYSTTFYSDGACQNIVGAVGVRNGYCLSPDPTISYKLNIQMKASTSIVQIESNQMKSLQHRTSVLYGLISRLP